MLIRNTCTQCLVEGPLSNLKQSMMQFQKPRKFYNDRRELGQRAPVDRDYDRRAEHFPEISGYSKPASSTPTGYGGGYGMPASQESYRQDPYTQSQVGGLSQGVANMSLGGGMSQDSFADYRSQDFATQMSYRGASQTQSSQRY
jgi:hypothetical protein